MRLLIIIIMLVVACGDNTPPPCEDVGCKAEQFLVCTRDGECQCPQPDIDPVACYREPRSR